MVKFLFTTQTQFLTTFPGPVERYSIEKGKPFEVTNEEDIAFFDWNPRFVRYGVVERVKRKVKKKEPKKDVDVLLAEELESLGGLSKKTIKKVVDTYVSKDQLEQSLGAGDELDFDIPETQREKILSHFLYKEEVD